MTSKRDIYIAQTSKDLDLVVKNDLSFSSKTNYVCEMYCIYNTISHNFQFDYI